MKATLPKLMEMIILYKLKRPETRFVFKTTDSMWDIVSVNKVDTNTLGLFKNNFIEIIFRNGAMLHVNLKTRKVSSNTKWFTHYEVSKDLQSKVIKQTVSEIRNEFHKNVEPIPQGIAKMMMVYYSTSDLVAIQ
jgi:hypothetical protein